MLAGSRTDTHGIAKGFMTAIGFGALSDVKSAYVEKARGGTDELGIKWAPLAPSTIANRRVGPGDKRDNPDIAERERIRTRETKKALARFRLSLPENEARRRAAIVGSIKATKLTGKTKIQTLGNRNVEILRDTGVLLNSLSPGRLVQAGGNVGYDIPHADQIFMPKPGEVIVGTTVEYSSYHQQGTKRIPARPFLPQPGRVPSIWWNRWLAISTKALAASVKAWLERGGR